MPEGWWKKLADHARAGGGVAIVPAGEELLPGARCVQRVGLAARPAARAAPAARGHRPGRAFVLEPIQRRPPAHEAVRRLESERRSGLRPRGRRPFVRRYWRLGPLERVGRCRSPPTPTRALLSSSATSARARRCCSPRRSTSASPTRPARPLEQLLGRLLVRTGADRPRLPLPGRRGAGAADELRLRRGAPGHARRDPGAAADLDRPGARPGGTDPQGARARRSCRCRRRRSRATTSSSTPGTAPSRPSVSTCRRARPSSTASPSRSSKPCSARARSSSRACPSLQDALAAARPAPVELLPALMIALLVGLTVESLLANRFYRRPASGEGPASVRQMTATLTAGGKP